MESASLHLSQLKASTKGTRVPRTKLAGNFSRDNYVYNGSGNRDALKASAQLDTARSIQREALKLNIHKQTLLKQIDLAENIAKSITVLQSKAECLKEGIYQEDDLSLSQELRQSEVDLQKESASIEEQVLNILERRISEYEALVLKLADRSSRLFSLHYEAKDLVAQLADSNIDLVKRHLAVEKARIPESQIENRSLGDKKQRHDSKRLVKRSIKQ